MKKILLLAFSAIVVVSCGKANKQTAESHDGHDHAPGVECGSSTAKAAATHTHDDGTECSGDHGNDSHAGHDHDSHAGHDHAAATHTHDDGTECSGDHGNDSHAGHNHDSHAGHNHDSHDGHDHGSENPDEIIFPAAQAARTDFEVRTVAASTFSDVIKTSGQILPAQGDEVTLVAPVSGIVSLAGVRLSDGNNVSKAQRLFYISSRNVASGDIMVKYTAAYEKAKADYERAEALLADNIVSKREFEAIRAEYLQAKADYESIAGTQSDKGTVVSAPIQGFITGLSVGEGDYVEMGQVLASVSQSRRLVLRAEVSQRYYQRLRNVRSANFTVPYDNQTYRLADMGGRVLSIGKASVSGTSLIPVTFEFDNAGDVVQGSFVEVFLIGSPVADAVTLPLTAITEQQGLYYVYIQLDEECYMRREVKLGNGDGVNVRILSGIEPGERVVTRGAINVKLAAASGAIPHSHEH